MDINKTIEALKQEPGFADNVGMMLVHNGVVRAWSRTDRARVTGVNVTPDHEKIQAICREFEKRPGIFRVVAAAREGMLMPGDDLLFLVVAGDIRENVLAAFTDLLNTVKKEGVVKQELLET